MHKAEDIGEGSLAPAQRDLRGLQSRRSAREVAAYLDGSGGLQNNATAPWLGRQLKLPATQRDLFDAARDSGKSKRQFLIFHLQLHASFVNFDSLQAIYRWNGRRWPINGRRLR